MTAAIHELLGDTVELCQAGAWDEEQVEQLDWTLEETELQVDRRFFDRPVDLSLVEILRGRLGTYFTFHLGEEWRRPPQGLRAPLEALEGPFAEAAEREQGWMLYGAWLQKQVAEPVFGETFSLSDVYIRLRGYRERPGSEEAEAPAPERRRGADERVGFHPGEGRGERVAVDPHGEIERWLDRESPQSTIRLVSGGPGSGRSTLARMLAAEVIRAGRRRVLYIPFPLLDVSGDLVTSLDHLVSRDRFPTVNPLRSHDLEEGLLLILDVLDC